MISGEIKVDATAIVNPLSTNRERYRYTLYYNIHDISDVSPRFLFHRHLKITVGRYVDEEQREGRALSSRRKPFR